MQPAVIVSQYHASDFLVCMPDYTPQILSSGLENHPLAPYPIGVSPRVLIATLILIIAPMARAGVGRVAEISLPSESPSLNTGYSPVINLQLDASASLAMPGLTPSLQPLAPSAIISPIAQPLARAPIQAATAKSVDALRLTGAALTKSAPASPAASQELGLLFDAGAAKAPGDSAVAASASDAIVPPLSTSRPAPFRRMPPGVAKAFQNSAVLGGGMAGLSAALWFWMQTLASPPSAAAFGVIMFPLLLIPFHFALVSSFWASRYYAYPKMNAAGKAAFRRTWQALARAYPAAALATMAFWLQTFGREPALMLLLGLPALVALGEVAHHFVYRAVSERAQDDGKSLLDWRSRLGGNIGQQLSRMRRKP